MKIEWELTARMLFNQLSDETQEMVLACLDRIPTDIKCWTTRENMQVLAGVPGSTRTLYVMRAGSDLRVILAHHRGTIVVVDVIPLRQIEGFRAAARTH